MSIVAILTEIEQLSHEEKRQVLLYLVDALTLQPPLYNILDFEGVGTHLYDGTDAQDYINTLREEWDHLSPTLSPSGNSQ